MKDFKDKTDEEFIEWINKYTAKNSDKIKVKTDNSFFYTVLFIVICVIAQILAIY